MVVVTVTNDGPLSFENVSGAEQGAVAVSVWLAVAPSFTVMFAGCVRVGARSVFAMVSTVVVVPVSVPSLTLQLML